MRVDAVLLVLSGLLLASLAAFLLGIIPYPFGLIVLTIFILARVFYLKDRGK
jgi:dihydroxy-acid dehydratase